MQAAEEREFYLRWPLRERWGKRELERQLAGALFERDVLSPAKRRAGRCENCIPGAQEVFRDAYLVEFLELPAGHSEDDLHAGLVRNLKRFLVELGRDFCFIGSKYPLQVGGKDFVLDLLFFHRGLNALVAIELKIGEFEPEHLGKLEFYLEALDRDVRKPHEGPSIGVLLCATKDSEVVEYALSRSLSPALVAEYQTRLPDKKLLQAKLHEFYALTGPELGERLEQSGRSTRERLITISQKGEDNEGWLGTHRVGGRSVPIGFVLANRSGGAIGFVLEIRPGRDWLRLGKPLGTRLASSWQTARDKIGFVLAIRSGG